MTGVEEAALIAALSEGAAAATAGSGAAALGTGLAAGEGLAATAAGLEGAGALGTALEGAGALGTALEGAGAFGSALEGAGVVGADALAYDGGLALTQGLLAAPEVSAPLAAEQAVALGNGLSLPSSMSGLGSTGVGGLNAGADTFGSLSAMQSSGISPSVASRVGSQFMPTAMNSASKVAAGEGLTSGLTNSLINPNYTGVGSQFMPEAMNSASQLAANQGFMSKFSESLTDPKNMMKMGSQGMKMMSPQQQQQRPQASMPMADTPSLRQAKAFAALSPYAGYSQFDAGFNPKKMKGRFNNSGLLG